MLISVVLNDDNELTDQHYLQTQDSLIIHEVPQHRVFVLTIENTINPKANTALERLVSFQEYVMHPMRSRRF